MNKFFENILNAWNKIKKETEIEIDVFYIKEFFSKCNPVIFENGVLKFEVEKNDIFNKLEKDGVFNKLKKTIPEIKECKTQPIKLDSNIIVDIFNKGFVDVCEKTINKNYTFNPVFVHSNPGLGKTLILKNTSKQIGSSAKYYHMNDFIKDIYAFFNKKQNKELEEFKNDLINKYHVILFDDIQFLKKKEKISDIFFQIINNNKNLNLIFAADVHPEELININKRIISRLQEGIVLKLDTPDFETCKKIIKQKFELLKFPINKIEEEVINKLSENFRSDLRKLEGIIKKIVFNTKLNKKKSINLEDVKIILNNFKFSSKSKITPNKIIKIIASYYGVGDNFPFVKQRKKEKSTIKYMAMYLIREQNNETYIKMTTFFQVKSHATIISGIKKFRELLRKDKNLKNDLKNIKKECEKY